MASSYILSGLTDYVEVHKDELLTKATLDFVTAKYVDIMPNVKYKDAIPTLDSTVFLQDGSSCGFNPLGSDVWGERFVETKAVKSEREWCYKDWEKKYGNYQLLWEAGRETLPFEEKMCNHILGLIQEAVEDLSWKGDSGLSIDGFIKLISDTESASTINVTGITSANTIVEAVDAVVAALPLAALKKGVYLYMSPTNFRKYVAAKNSACVCTNRDPLDAAVDELVYAGDSRVTIVSVYGIGDAYLVAGPKDAFIWATDIENAENRYRLWFDEKDEMFRMRVLFRAGTALRYPDEIAYVALP